MGNPIIVFSSCKNPQIIKTYPWALFQFLLVEQLPPLTTQQSMWYYPSKMFLVANFTDIQGRTSDEYFAFANKRIVGG